MPAKKQKQSSRVTTDIALGQPITASRQPAWTPSGYLGMAAWCIGLVSLRGMSCTRRGRRQPPTGLAHHAAGFEHAEAVEGYIRGYRRVFYQGSTGTQHVRGTLASMLALQTDGSPTTLPADHRGTPEAPGRTVTLVPDPAAVTVSQIQKGRHAPCSCRCRLKPP